MNKKLGFPFPRRNMAARWVLISAVLVLGVGSSSVAEVIEPRAIHVVKIVQAITPATTSFLEKAITDAVVSEAEVLIVQLDTPGGLLEATRQIVQLLLASRIPVVVYISPAGARGASAGTMITLASHVAAMAPATNLGAAHPVSLFGLGGDNKVMGEKIVNDTSAFIEGIARLRGRNSEWAISAVRESKSITADRALELNVIEIVAENLTDLVRQLDGRQVRMSETRTITLNTLGKPVILREMGFSMTFRSLLANPNLVFLLLIVGLVGLYIEFSNPGMFFPGIIGAISLLLALIALQTLPVSYGAVGLIFLGVALLVAEAFIPSFGILGIGGLISMLMGSIFLFDPETTDLRVSLPIAFGSVITVGVIGMVVGRLIVKSFRAPTVSFQDNLVGKTAEVREKIGPGRRGRVFLNGELWMAVSEATLKEGQKVVVESAEGLVLKVARGSGDAAATPTQPRVAT